MNKILALCRHPARPSAGSFPPSAGGSAGLLSGATLPSTTQTTSSATTAQQPLRIKIAVLGDEGCGKSTFIQRLKGGSSVSFSSSVVPKTQYVSDDEFTYPLLTPHVGVPTKISLWQGPGQATRLDPNWGRSMLKEILKDVDGIILMMDSTQADAIKNADNFLTLVTEVQVSPKHGGAVISVRKSPTTFSRW